MRRPKKVPDPVGIAGMRVLVTRPAQQSQGLAAMLRTRGAIPVCIAAIRIEACAVGRGPRDTAAALARGDIALFTSANAVAHGHALLPPRGNGYLLGAVGAATARALGSLGMAVDLVPRDAYNSEALLGLDELARERVAGHRVALFKGVDGRKLLADELRARGAEVTTIAVYRRVCPGEPDAARLRATCAALDAVVVTSGEALNNLREMLGPTHRDWLARVPLVVASERIAGIARGLGAGQPLIVARRAADGALAEALDGCRGSLPEGRFREAEG